jgi:uncharacterized protein
MMLQKKNTTCFLHLLVCLFYYKFRFAQFDIPKNPIFKLVYDYAKVLSDAEKHN